MNRLIKNFEEIKAISSEKGVDLEVATMMYISKNEIKDFAPEKEQFDKAYVKWLNNDFNGEIADYLEV